MTDFDKIWGLYGLRYKSHPWHGVSIGDNVPNIVTSFIEVVPSDTIKYELDKETGFLKVDRPQKYSNAFPALYGFIPQTFCGDEVAENCNFHTDRTDIIGDNDPLDICVLTEKYITHSGILVQAIPIGGFRMIDGGEADDKIIAIMKGDEVYSNWDNIDDCPQTLIERLRHYFLTYKDMPGQSESKCQITHLYNKTEAHEVIRRSRNDYLKKFGNIEQQLSKATISVMNFEKKRTTD